MPVGSLSNDPAFKLSILGLQLTSLIVCLYSANSGLSHHMLAVKTLKELKKRGHEVTVVNAEFPGGKFYHKRIDHEGVNFVPYEHPWTRSVEPLRSFPSPSQCVSPPSGSCRRRVGF